MTILLLNALNVFTREFFQLVINKASHKCHIDYIL